MSKESVLKFVSVARAFDHGGLHVLALDKLCADISSLDQSELPIGELLACAMSRGCNDASSLDALKMILSHLDDLSMIRAMVEQFLDQLTDVPSNDVQGWFHSLSS